MITPGRSKRRLDGWEIVLAVAAVLWLVTVATYAILTMRRTEGKALLLRNGRERAEYGCTTTWKNADGETVSVHRGGSPKEAVRSIARDVLELDDTYRLVSYPTPETVYRDVVDAASRLVATARTPESAILAVCGLHDLLHPDAPTHVTETFHRRSGHH